MDNELFKIIDGGYAKCTPLWNENPSRKDNCYKIYFPISGHASVRVDNIWYNLEAGNAYFINGYLLDQNQCNAHMGVYWLHFIPQSLYLSMQLDQYAPFYCLDYDNDWLKHMDPQCILGMFDHPDPTSKHNTLHEFIPLSVSLKVTAMIAMLLSIMIEKENLDLQLNPMPYQKLKPSIDYMDKFYTQNLSLEEIAKESFLNPVYFLRLFKKNFHITPNQYLHTKRLNEGCVLLKRTDWSIQKISDHLGYCNQFYFSKVFKDYYKKTPSVYRSETLFK